jgi:antitoxin HicB
MVDAGSERKIAELLRRPYRKVIRGDPEQGFLAEAPELPGCFTDGETAVEALENLMEAMAGWFEVALERGIPIPVPTVSARPAYSGRLLLRVPKTLHRRLAERAKEEGVSINQFAVAALARDLG